MKPLSFVVVSVVAASWLTIEPVSAQHSEEALNRHLEEFLDPGSGRQASPGSLYLSQSYLAELARDPRAATVGDLITINVVEQASALSSGATSSSRSSDSDFSVGSLLGTIGAGRVLPNLARSAGEEALQGQGSTSRETRVTTTLTAYVSHVLPNGNLVIEGIKEVAVNSERQLIWLRGMVRPADLAVDNSVRSDRIAMMDLRINGKGVVNDAIRRPNLLFRIFKGLLPF
jgi:flagellar L-ring protein precursor FlgH